MNQFNPESAADKKPHNVLLYDSERSLVLIGFEDMNREGGSDDDFNDAVFYTTATPETAIKYTNLPVIVKTNDRDKDGVPDSIDEFPDDVNLAYTTHYPSLNTYYTLAFEDLWPNRGDYDMNDVVITYNSTHYLNGMSQVSKIVDRIKPVWAGGQIGSGYGYQLGIPSSGVSSVTKTSTYTDNNFTYTLLPNGTEQGQTNATIMVFDNINDLNVTSPQKPQFNMEIRLTTPQTVDKITTPPYNPFIVINTGDKRSKEVHLPNYKPTDKADKSLLGTYNDKSSVSANRYYVSDDNMPFAIQIPNASFEYPTEATSITVYYPYFLQWAQSFGVQYPDWYTRKR
jgi:LruC domain-containing protein